MFTGDGSLRAPGGPKVCRETRVPRALPGPCAGGGQGAGFVSSLGFPVRPTMFRDECMWLTKLDLEINAISEGSICI